MAAEVSERLGRTKVRKLRGADLDAFYAHLRARGLSASTVRRYHAVLSAALHQAVRWDLIERSPAVQATPPPMPISDAACPTPDEVKQLIEVAATHDAQLSAFLFVAASTGCRRGELCGLRWSDIDLDTAQLVIRRAISEVTGQLEVRTTKTGRIRRMAIDPNTVSILRTQQVRAELSSRAVDRSLDANAYVWSQSADHSEPWRPSRVTAAFIRTRNEARLRPIRLHHLRHFSATVMLAGGVDVRTAAGRLGHAQPAITLKTYAHVMEAADRDAANLVGRLIAAPRSE
jgi:integrase